ncbi:winged helix-turn-helix transcriptional regulator [Amycolatopsis rhizosphaerae]|uniref:Winged helix-turn-helix transcriptional regulator n=2 Tax=Amycolatopsis rhizosphaerae TaxID=2053003 RepID=A0A558C702_9PSEU|nr:winged helix-turn-helix transcriptional regulator [Amycolatopsis rhizosphaerae]
MPTVTGSLALALVGAGQAVRVRVEDRLAPLGLTLRHLGALGHLSRRPDLSYSDLARRAGITAQSMHATVRQLQELGAITKATTGKGQRARLEVTPRGHELLAAVAAELDAIDGELFQNIGEDAKTQLKRALLELAFSPGGSADR